MTNEQIIFMLKSRYPQTKNARTILAMGEIAIKPSTLYSYRAYPHYPVNALLMRHSPELAIGWDEINDQLTDLYSYADTANFMQCIKQRYRWVGGFYTLNEWVEKWKDQINAGKAAWGHGFGPPPDKPANVRDLWLLLRNPS